MRLCKPLRIGNKLKRWYEQAGFVDVQEEVFKLPLNGWPREPRLSTLGTFWAKSMLDGLQGFSLAYFSRAFGWTKEQIEVYLVDVRKAISDEQVHCYHKMYFFSANLALPLSYLTGIQIRSLGSQTGIDRTLKFCSKTQWPMALWHQC